MNGSVLLCIIDFVVWSYIGYVKIFENLSKNVNGKYRFLVFETMKDSGSPSIQIQRGQI